MVQQKEQGNLIEDTSEKLITSGSLLGKDKGMQLSAIICDVISCTFGGLLQCSQLGFSHSKHSSLTAIPTQAHVILCNASVHFVHNFQ